jgi:hypothetical protein
LNWTRLGVDGDGDGYYSDVDCNDNDATKWRNLPGYRDIDSDLIGGGSLLQVCSGNNLTNGYSQSGGDCNDTNANVYGLLNGYLDSDLDERGSGNILQVCSGEELPSGYSNSGTDCNDSDGSIWRLVNGYLDGDDDGFGIGDVLEACSGFNLAPGFSTNNQDCNDLNSSINPDAIEIPYDGMDQTCRGYDLADVDKDGYCNAGYLIQNASLQCSKETNLIGTDCNDEDLSFNSASIDLLKNCKNEAPVLNPMDSIRVKETELASLIINATDPDGDNLTYFVNDSRFYQDENNTNMFAWQTDYLDVGKYTVEIIVGDGEFNVTSNIGLEVIRSNRAPICEEIPIIQFNEEENVLIDLNEYCFDDDFDSLTFSIVGNPNLN